MNLEDYLPSADELDPTRLRETRTYLRNWFLQLEEFQNVDMSPNSVFGDLLLTGYTYMAAALEIAASRMFSDIDLANVAAGTIYNCDFVKRYISNFGLGQVYSYPSTGVLQLVWSTTATKVLDSNTRFVIASSNGEEYAYVLSGVTDQLTVRSPFDTVDPNDPNEVQTVRDAQDRYILNLPVTGPPGVGINDDTRVKSDIPHPDLVDIRVIGDFDRGTLPENLMELAQKAQKTFYSATLNNRNGAISFLLQALPELRGVSPVLSGDAEMLRDTTNILGIKEGKVDIYIKGRTQYRTAEVASKLVYNSESNTWFGLLATPAPAVRLLSVARRESEQNLDISQIHGRSVDPIVPGTTAAYSKYEELSLELIAPTSSTDTSPENRVGGELDSNAIAPVFTALLSGVYEGNPFNPDYERTLTLQLLTPFQDSETNEWKISARVIDSQYPDRTADVVFKQKVGESTKGVIEDSTQWDLLVPGVTLTLHTNDASEFQSSALQLAGVDVELYVRGRGTTAVVRYQYDPVFTVVDTLVSDEGVAPVNTDIVTKNFVTCFVQEINILYRRKEGTFLNIEKAREDIVRYVNSLVYPEAYEEHQIAEIVLYHGAHGVKKVTQSGIIYPSVASKYHVDSVEIDVPSVYTTSLLPEADIDGVGYRNINYILNSANIKFDAITI